MRDVFVSSQVKSRMVSYHPLTMTCLRVTLILTSLIWTMFPCGLGLECTNGRYMFFVSRPLPLNPEIMMCFSMCTSIISRIYYSKMYFEIIF